MKFRALSKSIRFHLSYKSPNNNNLDKILNNIDVVVISDYGKRNITKETITKEVMALCEKFPIYE